MTEAHWTEVYGDRSGEELGWYEPGSSTLSVVTAHSTPGDSVLDVGGGDSRLVDALLDSGYEDVTVLDLSVPALESARRRLGVRAEAVEWIHGDVTCFEPTRRWDLWHDRAVFHFLVAEADRDAYRAAAQAALNPEGRLVVATFSLDGPEQCAGLPVQRYDVESLAAAFAPEFDAITAVELPPGPSGEGDQRPYIAAIFKRAVLQF